jgi:hypothetical protein
MGGDGGGPVTGWPATVLAFCVGGILGAIVTLFLTGVADNLTKKRK